MGLSFNRAASGLAASLIFLLAPSASNAAAVVGDVASVSGAFQSMQTRRVDVIGLGDSNQVLGGHGWDHGFQHALNQKYAMYGTGLISGRENDGNGSGVGYGFGASLMFPSSVGGPLPAELQKYATNIFPAGHLRGTFSGGSLAIGLDVTSTAFDVRDAVDLDTHYATWTTGDHTFQPAARNQHYSQIGGTSIINATTGQYGLARATVNVPADASRTLVESLHYMPHSGNDTTDTAIFWNRATRPGATAGYSYHTLAYYGGHPTKTIASTLQSATNESLSYYFGEIRRGQGAGAKRVVLVVNEGLNDRNDGTPSVGPSPAPGNSAAGFKDNTLAIVNRVTGIWNANGWDTAELHWVFMPSHPINPADDAALDVYRVAAGELTGMVPRSVALDLSQLTTHESMLASGFYLSSADFAHLSQAGYESLSIAAVNALTVPEPGTAGCIGVAVAALLLRRRARNVALPHADNDNAS